MSPPMTTTAGLSMLTHVASTPPMACPAWRISRTASCWPCNTCATTSRPVAVSSPSSRRLGGQRCATGDRFEAAEVPATTDDVVVVGYVDVADVACRAVRPPVHVPVGDDARADPGPDLHEQQEVFRPPVRPVLAEAHDVHVVVDQSWRGESFSEPLANGIEVPARHDRRAHRSAGGEFDRARQTDPDAAYVIARDFRSRAGGDRTSPRAKRGRVSGPFATAMSWTSWASTSPARSVTATREWVAPRSPASTTPASPLNASIVGRRPPVEALSPPGTRRRCEIRASTRCAMVERASPVIAASSPRVLARPVRTRSRIAPAEPLEAGASGPGPGRHGLWRGSHRHLDMKQRQLPSVKDVEADGFRMKRTQVLLDSRQKSG